MRFDTADLSLGWREGLLFLVVILALYMLFELIRIRRLRRQKQQPEPRPAIEPTVAIPPTPTRAEPETPSIAAPARDPAMALEMAAYRDDIRNEVAQMREELDALRAEFAALREEMRGEAAHLKASQSVSPLYSDAMQMAMNGYAPEVIAERCGIARAEAELVIALAKNREE